MTANTSRFRVANLVATIAFMQQKQNQLSRQKPPRFLNGIFILILVVIALILTSSWLIINHQLDSSISSRTSEYAHSIAKIAASLAADPLLSEDQLQLQMLVDNVAKDPYVKQASIFAENGQVIAESISTIDTEPLSSIKLSANNEPSNPPQNIKHSTAEDYSSDLQTQPYIESIIYQEVTHGWFKLILDKNNLERSFVSSLNFSKNIILLLTALLLISLLIIQNRLTRPIKQIIQNCQRLIQLNAAELPTKKDEWLQSLEELSQTQFIADEPIDLIKPKQLWHSSKRHAESKFCYCQFSMQAQENENTAQSLALAEHYLQATTKAYGVSVQGNILSGCLIPFFDSETGLNDIFCFTQLLKQLLLSIELPIEIRTFVGSGAILTLSNERNEITGLSLSNRLSKKINQLTAYTTSEDTIFINFEQPQLQKLGEFKSLKNPLQLHAIQLISPDEKVIQQISRQLHYIKQNNHN
jgi:uncharacterized membrane protein affecting hemolysin expression